MKINIRVTTECAYCMKVIGVSVTPPPYQISYFMPNQLDIIDRQPPALNHKHQLIFLLPFLYTLCAKWKLTSQLLNTFLIFPAVFYGQNNTCIPMCNTNLLNQVIKEPINLCTLARLLS